MSGRNKWEAEGDSLFLQVLYFRGQATFLDSPARPLLPLTHRVRIGVGNKILATTVPLAPATASAYALAVESMIFASSILITLTALCTTCLGADPSPPQKDATPQTPPYRSSVVGTDFDFITGSDPDAFDRLEDKGQGPAEMPDKANRSAPLVQQAFLFMAHFDDGTRVRLAIDAGFQTQESARREALRFTSPLGKLPTALRRWVERVVVHKGGEKVTAFSDAGLIVVYADNATRRLETHDLEETVFHEAVHAAWDKKYAKSAEWQDAQQKDGGYVTDYARMNPQGEDLAESALFAYTLLHHPNRIPKEEEAKIARIIPHRIAFVEKLLPKDKPLHFPVEVKP